MFGFSCVLSFCKKIGFGLLNWVLGIYGDIGGFNMGVIGIG